MTLARHLTCYFIAACWLAGCSQSEGDPCQVTSDCGSGLLCCPAEDTPRGVCIRADSCPEFETDTDPPDDGDDADSGAVES